MNANLLVSVLGNRNSGKSHTWNTMFGQTVRTGNKLRRLYLTESEYVEVFLVSGSAEERKKPIGDIMTLDKPRIALCSMQYSADVTDTIENFVERDYFLFVHWLNPGHKDHDSMPDTLNLIQTPLSYDSLVGVRNGQVDAISRVQEMRSFIYGWAKDKGLLHYTIEQSCKLIRHGKPAYGFASRQRS